MSSMRITKKEWFTRVFW